MEVAQCALLITGQRRSELFFTVSELVDGWCFGSGTSAPIQALTVEVALGADLGAASTTRLGEVALDAAFLAGPARALDGSDSDFAHVYLSVYLLCFSLLCVALSCVALPCKLQVSVER